VHNPDAEIPGITFATIDRESVERYQSLRRSLQATNLGINVMVLAPGQRARIHAHDHQEEIYLILEGQLTLVVEGVEHVLGPDQLARVASATRRQLANAGTQRVVLIALGASGEHAGRDARAWRSWQEDGPGLPPQEVALPDDLPI
jgi:uncharacterized cupin superfamily protein